jgi:predicted ATPase/uncharacterized protein HemY/DNA-binding XRE family transcriptional regulator
MDRNNSARKKLIPLSQLRKERERHGWTHKDVADRIGLPDPRTVGRWERGIYFPSAHYRQELCQIFEKTLEELDLLRRPSDKDEEDAEPNDVFHSLPVFFSSFIGREQDVNAASSTLMLQDVRLLTLLGTGGIGKTRLALEVATQVREHFQDGVYFVSLDALHDPSLVISSIADVLGVHGNVEIPLVQQVKMFLRKKHLLLLLDNFEHVVNASPVVEEILQSCPYVKVMATSRELLGLQAEREFKVLPLSLPDLNHLLEPEGLMHYTAIALFVLRAQTFLPSFEVNQNNASVVAELCTRLDGLPLAIELAAARVKMLSLQSLLARFTQNIQVLESNLRTVPERQRTLYQTIEWSYELLDPQEKWFFCHFSVFAGGATLETIEAFFQSHLQQPMDLMRMVSSLSGKSLLQCLNQESAEPRFSMLGTIRQFALNCLRTGGELEESQGTYASYYLTVVEEAASHLKGSQQLIWLKKIGREQSNLRAALDILLERQETERALRFCEAFGKFYGLSGYWSEEQHLLDTILSLPYKEQEKFIRAKVLRRAGHLAYRLRELVKAHLLLEESITYSREMNDKENLVGALITLGRVLYRQNEMASASDVMQESMEVAYQSGDDWVLANALEGRGQFLYRWGDINEARQLLEESVALSRKLADKENLARILTTLVEIEIALGNRERASSLAQESYIIALELGTGPLIALTLDTLGYVALFQGAYEQAKHYIEERIVMAHEFGDVSTIASRHLKLADIALAQGHPEQATKLVEEALTRLHEQKDIPCVINALSVLGDLKRCEGDLLQAKSFYKQALQFHKELEDEKKFGRCLAGLAQLFWEQQQGGYAVSLCSAVEARLNADRDMHPAQYAAYQQMKESLRTQLDEASFCRAWSQGSTATLELLLETLG